MPSLTSVSSPLSRDCTRCLPLSYVHHPYMQGSTSFVCDAQMQALADAIIISCPDDIRSSVSSVSLLQGLQISHC